MDTLKSLAAKLDLSIATVSMALNHSPLVSKKTAARVWALANELNYRPNNIGKALQAGRNDLIGCLIHTLLSSFFNELLEGMGQKAAQERFGLLASWSNGSDSMLHINQMLAQRVSGVVFSGYDESFPQISRQLERAGVEIVFCSTHLHGDYPFVVTDDFSGGEMAAKYLISCGHRRLLVQDYPVERRLQGCLKAFAAAPHLSFEIFEQLAGLPEQIRRTGATGIIFFSDIDAMDGMYLLRQQGFRIPEDLSVIGYDNLPVAARPEFELTTIGQQRMEIGSKAVEYLIRKSRGETPEAHQYLAPELVVRKSVRTL